VQGIIQPKYWLAKILVGQFRKKNQTHPKCSGALLTNTKKIKFDAK
jgi:hypothetical protein